MKLQTNLLFCIVMNIQTIQTFYLLHALMTQTHYEYSETKQGHFDTLQQSLHHTHATLNPKSVATQVFCHLSPCGFER